jgi:hypothetical protein
MSKDTNVARGFDSVTCTTLIKDMLDCSSIEVKQNKGQTFRSWLLNFLGHACGVSDLIALSLLDSWRVWNHMLVALV